MTAKRKKTPKSFMVRLRQKYRVYYNTQTHTWYAAHGSGKNRKRTGLGVKTRPEAEGAVEQLDGQLFGQRVKAIEGRVLWPVFASSFLDFKRGKGLAPRSIDRYRVALEAFERHLDALGHKALHDVTLPVLEAYTAYRTGSEKCDPKTAYNDAITIKGAFKWAAKPSRGLLAVNPALDWETPEPVKPKRRCYTRKEVEQMEAGVRPWLRPIVTTLAWSGLRIGELVSLFWRDVDIEKKLMHVRVRTDWRPKGKRDRSIPMGPNVLAVVGEQRIGKLVFTGPRGGTLKETYVLECLKKDQEKLKMKKGDLHAFRRYFATTMMRANVDPDLVRQWGGWKSLDTMLRYLGDVKAEESVVVMEKAIRRLAI